LLKSPRFEHLPTAKAAFTFVVLLQGLAENYVPFDDKPDASSVARKQAGGALGQRGKNRFGVMRYLNQSMIRPATYALRRAFQPRFSMGTGETARCRANQAAPSWHR